jgi:hypothetical protein
VILASIVGEKKRRKICLFGKRLEIYKCQLSPP